MKEIIYQYTDKIANMHIYIKLWNLVKYELLVLVSLLLLMYNISGKTQDTTSLFSEKAIFMCIFILIICTILFYLRLRNFNNKYWEGTDDRTIKLQFTEEKIRQITTITETEIPWKLIKKVSRSKGFWFLWIGGAQFFSIPASCLDSELKELINRKIK